MIPGRLWLVGCGNMGGAMLRRWIDAGLDPAQLLVIDPGTPALPAGVEQVATVPTGVSAPDWLVLAVKPQQLDEVAPGLRHWNGTPPVVLSILAGTEAATLAKKLNVAVVVRAMPNLPVAIGKGVTALWSDTADTAVREAMTRLCAPLGLVEWLAREDEFHAIIGLPGSGPGFVFRFIEALERGAIYLGLPPDQARRLAAATVEGAAALAVERGDDPHDLAARVASKGGTTQRGLDVLDQDAALMRLIAATMRAAADRSREMAAEAR